MTRSSASGSDLDAFELLRPEVRKWVHRQGWTALKLIQERAIRSVCLSDKDIVIMAGTASGKTEAAFLPILSEVAGREDGNGFGILYVSPLKALINDQFRRLEQLCEALELPVVRWHGDAPQSAKAAAAKNPSGVALITPESVEALLCRRPEVARRVFSKVRFVVIDELHAFLHSVRGLHLHSLLRRIEAIMGRRPRYVGLSATIGDEEAAARWLNPGGPERVEVVKDGGGRPELLLQLKGYVDVDQVQDPDSLEEDAGSLALDRIADHIHKSLRGSNNLVFAGSRRRVEALADRLRRRCEDGGIPNEYFPHHGSLSKEMREPTERRLKAGDSPTTAVATTTLELGIDIGSVVSVAEIGAPRTVSGLLQRKGRSGRREGVPSILRVYLREREAAVDADLFSRLRTETATAVSAIELMKAGYIEKPDMSAAVVTAVVQQTLSVIAERGGGSASEVYAVICGSGPLSAMSKKRYADLLRHMARPGGLIEQAPDGTLMLAREGEFTVWSKEFFALFETEEEWRVVGDGKEIGRVSLLTPVKTDSHMAFAGKRWRITSVDPKGRIIKVEPSRSGKMPNFESAGRAPISDEMAAHVRGVLASTEPYIYLDRQATALLEQGRSTYAREALAARRIVEDGGVCAALTWRGTAVNDMIVMALGHIGFEALAHDVGVEIAGVAFEEAVAAFEALASDPPILAEIAAGMPELAAFKYDGHAPRDVIEWHWIDSRRGKYAEALAVSREIALGLAGDTPGVTG